MQYLLAFGRSKSSSLNVLKKAKLLASRKHLETSLHKITQLRSKVDTEAAFALQKVNKENESKRHVEILSAIREDNRNVYEVTKKKRFSVPFARNRAFAGRDVYLDMIHSAINPETVQKSHEQRSLVLYGLGGVGKTQLALEYTHRYKESYDTSFWITCDAAVKITGSIAEMARIIGFGDQGPSQNKAALKEWMSTTEMSVLLILDNVEKPTDVLDLWPTGNRGSIIVTTQDSSWMLREDISHSIDVKSLQKDEGTFMVREVFARQKKSISATAAERIYEETGGLPLAIRQLGSYICASEVNPDTFMDMYHEISEDVDAWDESLPPSCPRTLANFLDFAFRNLLERDISTLSTFCFLDPDYIQEHLLFEAKIDPTHSSIRSRSDFDLSTRKLCRYCLILKTNIDGTVTYSIHRQVKRHLLSHLSSGQLTRGLNPLLERLGSMVPNQTPWEVEVNDKKWIHSPIISHIVALNREFSKVSKLTEAPELLARILLSGSFDLWMKGILKEGKDLIASAMTLCTTSGFNEQLSAEIVSFYGTLLADSGELDAALKSFQKSMDIQQGRLKRMGEQGLPVVAMDEIYLANAYNNLAGIHFAKADYLEARINNELSLFLKHKWEKDIPLSHLLCLSYQNLANTLAKQEAYSAALIHFEKAISFGSGEVSTARRALTYHNYGCMKLDCGHIEESLSLLEEAYQLRAESLGDHPDTAATLHMLSMCHLKVKSQSEDERLKAAKELLAESLRILEPRHSNIDKRRFARSLFKYSTVLEQLGDQSAALYLSKAKILYVELTGAQVASYIEDSYDALVPYT